VADEVGPSLRWASAQVTRNERRGGGDFGGGGGGGGNSGGGAPKPVENYDDFGEEPF
jgi:single-strand DNA-binding protein